LGSVKEQILRLTGHEQDVLSGKEGSLKQVALENIVKFAEVVGAERLCRVTKAHLFCGAHNYLRVCGSRDFHEVFTIMQLARQGEVIPFTETDPHCFAQSDVSVCDFHQYEKLGQSKALFDENRQYLDLARQAGVMLVGSCAPYLTGWLPTAGEHFVSTESSVTIAGNSLWGAHGNSDGIEAAFWSAICGHTPEFGLHLAENRVGTHHVKIEARLETLTDWDLLGAAVGRLLPANAVPVLTGDFPRPDFNRLRQFLTSLAISSNAQLCHIVGLTPEAPSLTAAFQGRAPQGDMLVTDRDLTAAYELVASPGEGPVDLVSFGCPHYDLSQVRDAAALLSGRKVHSGVKLMIWAPLPIKYLAEVNGLSKIIEEAGGALYAGSCPTTVGPTLLEPCRGLAFDSFKMCFSAKNMFSGPVYLGGMAECLAAAEAGRWREEFRWRAK
jgi:predicted aconitase